MKRILLVCSAGMSTSLLVQKMQEYAQSNNIESHIQAVSEAESKTLWQDYDVLLLGPQVRFLKAKMEEMTEGKIPVDIIDMRAYGSLNGEAVFNAAVALLNK